MTDNISEEVANKIEYLDQMLKKDFFSNPVREVQESMRQDLIIFKELLDKGLEELEKQEHQDV
jgi:hypothetical protein